MYSLVNHYLTKGMQIAKQWQWLISFIMILKLNAFVFFLNCSVPVWGIVQVCAMDCNRNFHSFPDTSLVLLSFLKQKGCQSSQLQRELDCLDDQLKLHTNHNYIESDEELQADGHSFSVSYRELLHEFQNQVQPQLPGILFPLIWIKVAPWLMPIIIFTLWLLAEKVLNVSCNLVLYL